MIQNESEDLHVSSSHQNPTGDCYSFIRSTGATGFIGGDVLYGLTQALAASSIVALVRNKSQAAAVTGQFPTATPLIGDLDSSTEIQQAASKADVVLSMC